MLGHERVSVTVWFRWLEEDKHTYAHLVSYSRDVV